jgi:zinc transport system ATP-binding protein
MALLLKVSRLRVQLDGATILEDVSFELHEGETLVILGPNGAGKTVLLKALLGILPHEGEVAWRERTRIGYVPQKVAVGRDLPVTVADFFRLKNVASPAAAGLLEQVGIADHAFLETQLGLLSSGHLQRVLIAWALADDPNAILFDEPTAGVDITGEDAIHGFLHRRQAENRAATILVTHDLSAVYDEATRVLCLNRKRYCYGPPQEVLDPRILREIYGRETKFFRHNHD